METHFNGYNSSEKNQESGILSKKIKGQYQNSEANGENSKVVNYWGKFRKPAVRTDPSILRHNDKYYGVDSCDDGEKPRNKGFQMGNCLLSPKGGRGSVHQVFDEMPERVKKSNKGLTNGEISTKNGCGAIEGIDTIANVGCKPKIGVEKGVINIGEERKKLLELYREECESLRKKEVASPRIDQMAYNKLKESGKLFMTEKKLGPMPGVEVENCFEFRLELVIMGIHEHPFRGIDYMETSNGRLLATSIVATDGYGDSMKADELVYTGEGGGSFGANGKGFKDQELKGGNLALKNSINEGNFVRVVRGVKSNGQCRGNTKVFVYDGLYKVVDYGKKKGLNGKVQFEFTLKRCSGQKTIAWAKYK